MSEYRAGILWVAPSLAGRARLALPPEHKVAAVLRDEGLDLEYWAIEGPRMPRVAAGKEPDVVRLLLTATWSDDDREMRLDAEFLHAPGDTWRCGAWPSYDDFRAAFEG